MNRIPEEQAFWQSTLDWLRDNLGSTGLTVAAIALAILTLTIVVMFCGRRATLGKAIAFIVRLPIRSTSIGVSNATTTSIESLRGT